MMDWVCFDLKEGKGVQVSFIHNPITPQTISGFSSSSNNSTIVGPNNCIKN